MSAGKAPPRGDLDRTGLVAADMAFVFGPAGSDSMRIRDAIRAYLWAVGLPAVSTTQVLAALDGDQ